VRLTNDPAPWTFERGETLRVTAEASAREGERARVLLFDNGLLLEGAERAEKGGDGDAPTIQALAPLDHPPTHAAVLAERALLAALQTGCLAPVGVWARAAGAGLQLDAVVLGHEGRHRVAVSRTGAWEEPQTLGEQAAAELLAQGAASLIAASRHAE